MSFNIKYKPLFKVNILHQYYLNKGEITYAAMSEVEKEKQLAGYNFSDFFTVQATEETLQKMKGHNMVFKATNSSIVVYARVSLADDNSPFVAINDLLELSFLLKLNTSTFFHLCNFEIESFAKLFFFSNQRLSSEATNFPLIKRAGTAGTVTANYTLTNASALVQYENLSHEEKKNLFGIVRIHMKGKSANLNVLTAQHKMKSPHQEFELNFENRKTFWRYIFNTKQEVESEDLEKEPGNEKCLVTKQEQPLTAHGFVSIELADLKLPNPDANRIKPNSTNNKIYSEIYM